MLTPADFDQLYDLWNVHGRTVEEFTRDASALFPSVPPIALVAIWHAFDYIMRERSDR
jgi:hypothetical protein